MQKRIEKTIDMTEGRLFTKILGFAIPVCLGLLFQQLYNLADTIIVGRMLGVNALAGVGSTTGLRLLYW
jgi:Na+-driven multidrug efflux pump